MTLAERLAELNKDCDGLRLTEDLQHWKDMKVETAKQLDKYLAVACHYDMYKDVYGIRPRWIDYEVLTLEEIDKMIAGLQITLKRQIQDERDQAEADENAAAGYPMPANLPPEVKAKVADPAPLSYSPFATLKSISPRG